MRRPASVHHSLLERNSSCRASATARRCIARPAFTADDHAQKDGCLDGELCMISCRLLHRGLEVSLEFLLQPQRLQTSHLRL